MSEVIDGFSLPRELCDAMHSELWRTTPQEVVSEVMPFLYSPIEFLTLDRMRTINRGRRTRFAVGETATAEELQLVQIGLEQLREFRIYCGSSSDEPRDLPWLDFEQAFTIADNLEYGWDFQCVFLDTRGTESSHRVVAPSISENDDYLYEWVEVGASFKQFWLKLQDADERRRGNGGQRPGNEGQDDD